MPMGLLFAYLSRSLLVAIGLVLLVIFALDFTGDFFYRFGRLADKVPVSSIIAAILLETPFKLLEFIPSALLIGGALGLGWLARGSEITVILASGCSRVRLLMMVLVVGLLFSVASLTIQETVGSRAITQMQKLETVEYSSRLLVAEDSSIWLKTPRQFIKFQEIVSDQLIKGISIYEFDDDFRLRRIVEAVQALYTESQWKLIQVNVTVLSKDKIERSQQDELGWSDFSFTDVVNTVNANPESLSVRDLHRHITELETNQLDTYPYKAALYQRYAFVFSALAMLAFSFPLVVSSRKINSVGVRVALAIMLSFVVYALSGALASAGSLYRLPPMLIAFLPTLIMLAATFYIMRLQR